MFEIFRKLFKRKPVADAVKFVDPDKVHVMIDIETMGKNKKAPVVSVGAVVFNPSTGVLGEEFSVNVDLNDSAKYGNIDSDTVLWWLEQARTNYPDFLNGDLVTLKEALTQLQDFIKPLAKRNKILVWGNGCDFDNVILENGYETLGLEPPWVFWNNQSVRTAVLIGREILGIDPKTTMEFVGNPHKALDDAKNQAKYVSVIWGQLEHILELVKLKEFIEPEELTRIIKLTCKASTNEVKIKAMVGRTKVLSDLDSMGKCKAECVTLEYVGGSTVYHSEKYVSGETCGITEVNLELMLGVIAETQNLTLTKTKEVKEKMSKSMFVDIELPPEHELSGNNSQPSVLRVADIGRVPGLGRNNPHGCHSTISGEEFLNNYLIPNIRSLGNTVVDLDGVQGYNYDWLEVVFGGLVREYLINPIHLVSKPELEIRKKHVKFLMNNIRSTEDHLIVKEIRIYMSNALDQYPGK